MLKEWSDWSEKIPDVGCAVQIRTRDFNKSVEWLERATCDDLESCPAIREEARTECKWWNFYEITIKLKDTNNTVTKN